jgi:hypothetical protein
MEWDAYLIQVASDRLHWLAFVKPFSYVKRQEISWPAEIHSISQKRLTSLELSLKVLLIFLRCPVDQCLCGVWDLPWSTTQIPVCRIGCTASSWASFWSLWLTTYALVRVLWKQVTSSGAALLKLRMEVVISLCSYVCMHELGKMLEIVNKFNQSFAHFWW